MTGISNPACSRCSVEVTIFRAANTSLESHRPIRSVTFTVNAFAGTSEWSSQRAVGDVPARSPGEIPKSQLGRRHSIVNPILGFKIGLVLISTNIGFTTGLFVSDLTYSFTAALAIQKCLNIANVAKLPLSFATNLVQGSIFSLQCSVLLQCFNCGLNRLDLFVQFGLLFLSQLVAIAQGVVEW